MTAKFHTLWWEEQFDGTLHRDLDGAGAVTLNMGLVTEATINPDTVHAYSALTPVSEAGTAWTGPVALSSLTCGLDGSFDLVMDAADPAQIDQDASGFADARSVVFYFAADGRIMMHHTEATAFGNTTGPLDILIDAQGLWKMTINP